VCGTGTEAIRDRALFLVGFAGALCRSELVGLDAEHVTGTKEGMRLLIVRSKTDKEGAGAEIGIPRGQAAETCPVAAHRLWLEEAGIKTGPLFRKVDRWGAVHTGRRDSDAVCQILKKRAAQEDLRHHVGTCHPTRHAGGGS
jgi:site-specific recombinase XerC